jgi:phage gp29-like protein
MDRTVFLDQSEVTPETVQTAKRSAIQGNLFYVARLNDTMVQGDPHVKSARLQRKTGVCSTKWAIKNADDSPEAEEIGDAVREATLAPDASFTDLLQSIVESILRGEGLTETIWSSAADTTSRWRRWIAFQTVPQSRLRWNLDGRFAMAETVGQYQGIPIEELPRGKFIPCLTDLDVPNYGIRGFYPAIWSPWLDRLYGRKWRRSYTERFGTPIPVGEFETETQAEALRQALLDFGVPGFVVPKGSAMTLEGGPSGGTDNPNRQIMLDAADEIAICLVGQAQTTQIRENAGSRASAEVQNLVRGDILVADWAIISHLVRQNLFGSFVEQNFGPDYLPLTPSIVPQLEGPADLYQLSQALEILVGLGLKVPASMLYRNGIQEPSGDDKEGLLEKAEVPEAFGGPRPVPGRSGGAAATGDGEDDPAPASTPGNAAKRERQLAERKAIHAIARRQELLEADMVDLIAGKYLAEGASAAKPMLGAIKAIVEKTEKEGGTLTQIKDRVLAAYGKLPLSQLTDVLASAILEAEIRGMKESAAEREGTK